MSDKPIKKEITDFERLYQEQPPDSVIVDGKKESLNLDLNNISKQVWLVKLPRFLASKWNDIDEIGGKEIGRLRIDKTQQKKDGDLKFKLFLNEVEPNVENDDDGDSQMFNNNNKKDVFEGLPHNYDLRVTNKAVKNQFVFSEQNLNTFSRSSNNNNNSNNNGGINKFGDKKKQRRQFWKEQKRYGANKYVQFTKSIPKKTAMVGTICHECSVTASTSDVNYFNVLKDRKDRVSKRPDRPTIGVLKENSGIIQRFSAPSLKGDDATKADAFIKANKEQKSKDQGKNIRIERKELLDLLFSLFDEYDYWSLKGIKERVKQPEGWLKECLDSIAVLIKRGPYASKYCLKPEYKKMRDEAKLEKAKELGIEPAQDDVEEEDEDDDEDVELENVV